MVIPVINFFIDFINIVDEDENEKVDKPPGIMMRILRLNSPEWAYILVGSVSAIVMGASFPAFAIIFGEFYGVS